MKVSTQGELVAHDPYNPPTLAVRAINPSFMVLARLTALSAEVRGCPELERNAPRAVALREACPVGALLLIDVRTIDKHRVAALEGRVDRVYDALSRLKYVLATPHDAWDSCEMLLEKRTLPGARQAHTYYDEAPCRG